MVQLRINAKARVRHKTDINVGVKVTTRIMGISTDRATNGENLR